MTRPTVSLSRLPWQRMLPYLLRFSIALLLAGTQLFGCCNPLSTGFLAACGPGLAGSMALLGCTLGSFLFFPFPVGLRCTATALLIFSAAIIFSDTEPGRNPLFAPVSAALMHMAVGFVYVGQAGWHLVDFLVLLLEALLSCGTCITARILLKHRPGTPRRLRQRTNPISSALGQRLRDAADTFRDLSRTLSSTIPEETENPSAVFHRSAQQVCRSCSLCSHCWEQNYHATFTALNDATPVMLQRGQAQGEDFPAYFTSRCLHFSAFLTAVNQELTAYLLRQQTRSQLQQSQAAVQQQYVGFSELLDSAAHSVETFSHKSSAKPPMAYQIGTGLFPRSGESISGDSFSAFETPEHQLFLLLSDGMGSGEDARKASSGAVHLLQQFLQSGIEPEPALKTLNSALAVHGQAGFTTMDLLQLDLCTGEGALYKYGAAPSYLRRGGQVTRIAGHSLPVGLEHWQRIPDRTPLHLEGECWLLLQSDGIADPGDDHWLMDLLAEFSGRAPQGLIGPMLSACRQHRGQEDDGCLLLLYLPPRHDTPAAV